MKTILKLVFLGIVAVGTWKYLDHDDIDVKNMVSEASVWIQDQLNELKSKTEDLNSAPEESPSPVKHKKEPSLPNPATNSIQTENSTEESTSRAQPTAMISHKIELEDNNPRQNESEPLNIKWIKTATKKYSPDSWHLLMLYDKLPQKGEASSVGGGKVSSPKTAGTFHYLKGNSGMDLLSSMSTNVHEIAHGYFNQNTYKYALDNGLQIDFDKAEGFIYLSPREWFFISFPHGSLFPSKELVDVIPYNLRTFRFSTYINGNTSTQSNGVIGLLNEFHAYYLGSKFSFEMLEAYKESEDSDADGLFQWVTNTQSSMSAFYEFDYFIREYLLNMKSNYPDDFSALMSNSTFMEAYLAIFLSYKELVNNYQLKIESEILKLNSSGLAEASIEDNYLWIGESKGSSKQGTPIFSEAREKLMPVIERNRYPEI